MKTITILCIVTSLFISGCSDTYPVPEEAVQACIDKNLIPTYTSNASHGTVFTCTKPDKQ